MNDPELMAPIALPSPKLSSLKSKSLSSIPNNTPTKSLLRTSSKRSRDDALSSPMASESPVLPPSSKRARTVTFNPLVEEKLFSTLPEAEVDSLEDVRRAVRRALEEHARSGGDDTRYDGLKELFARSAKANKAENESLKAHLLAMTSCVSLLGKNCSGLVREVLQSQWLGKEEGYVRAYVAFLGHLASTQGAYVGNVLNMLVDKFLGVRLEHGRLPDCPDMTRAQMNARVHMALRYLLRLIPSASGTLSPILDNKFPFSDENKKRHVAYIQNLIQILDYAQELKTHIFALITERLVKIDVLMQTDLENEDDEVAATVMHNLTMAAEYGSDSEESDTDSDSNSEEGLAPREELIRKMEMNVDKMDCVLDVLFELYTPYFSEPNSATAIAMFDTLLSQFRNIILPTYRSRHTQFLIFHFAQTSEHLIDTFAGECVDLAFKSGRPAVLKQSAAAYLASFVSRGAHVLPHVVRDVFNYIGVNLDIIRAENEVTCRGPDLQRYGTFYATTQALLYIFCFRWRDLIVSPSSTEIDADGNEVPVEVDEEDFINTDLIWHPGVKELFDRTIYSKLNPLKICAPSIVDEFARIANQLRFMYVYPLLATNKRIRLSQFTVGRGREDEGGSLRDVGYGEEREGWHQLDAYFPFDPYHLPRSKRWLEGDYQAWRGVPGVRDEEESGEEDEDEESSSSGESESEEEETATEDE